MGKQGIRQQACKYEDLVWEMLFDSPMPNANISADMMERSHSEVSFFAPEYGQCKIPHGME